MIHNKKALENIVGPAIILLALVVIVIMSMFIIEYNQEKYSIIINIEDAIVSTQTELYVLLNFNQCPVVNVSHVKCILDGDVTDCLEREMLYDLEPLRYPLSKWIGIMKAQSDIKLPIYDIDPESNLNNIYPKYIAYQDLEHPTEFVDLERCIRMALTASQILEDNGRRLTIPSIELDMCVDNSTDINSTCESDFEVDCGVALRYSTHIAAYSKSFEDVLVTYSICE